MDRFFEFVAHHYLLASLWAGLLIAFLFNERLRGGQSIGPNQLTALVNGSEALILDIRDSNEFRQGHITGARNVPFKDIASHLDELKKQADRPIVVVCNIGQTAGAVATQLKTAGLSAVYKLDGGVSRWKADGLPLVRSK